LPLTAAPAAAGARNFVAPLDSDQEVPSVDSRARGMAHFQLSLDGDELSYRLNVANIQDVLMAHIHLAPRGENGGIVVWLYPSSPPPELIPGRSNGTLATGTIAADDLVGDLGGEELSALLDAIEAGNTYVNVHTTANPAGEIRGQIQVAGPR
ncbi:MAG: CHRD domain-containing protein, partial [Gemmatimonadota bacterium]